MSCTVAFCSTASRARDSRFRSASNSRRSASVSFTTRWTRPRGLSASNRSASVAWALAAAARVSGLTGASGCGSVSGEMYDCRAAAAALTAAPQRFGGGVAEGLARA